ncbi:MAG: pirin family protein [Myxococcales bacterium]|nr:pirin family protein [Myxococcales bacterium]
MRSISAQDATLFGSWLLLDHFDSLVSRRPDYDPHPHAGMATLTYLFDGRLVHRDSIGTEQVIEANGLSWFHAGRGGMHSDRHHPLDRVREARLHGLELWVVLPRPNEHDPPAYAFHRPSAPVLGPRHNAGYFSASSKARVHEMTDQCNAGAFGTVLR